MFLFLEPTYHPGRSPPFVLHAHRRLYAQPFVTQTGALSLIFAYVGKGSHTRPTFLLKGKPYLFSQEEDGIFISRRGISIC